MRRRDDEYLPDFPDPPIEPVDPFVVECDIATPAAGALLTGPWNGVTVEVTGSVRIVSGTGAVERVEVSVGGAPFEPAAAAAPGAARWSFAKLVDTAMALPIAARVIGAGGVVLTDRSTSVTTALAPKPEDGKKAETKPPALRVQRPMPEQAIVADAVGDASVEVAIEATPGDRPIARVEILADGRLVDGVSVKDRGDATIATATVPLAGLGEHAIAVRVFDDGVLESEATVDVRVISKPIAPPVVERLFLVEKCRLVTFAGAFGAGQVAKIVTLAPQESCRISMKTYKRSSETAAESSSILDSNTKESQDDFEQTLSREQSNKRATEEALKFEASGEGKGTWGLVSASVKAGVTATSNASREELAKNVLNAVRKHAEKASSKRDVEIKTSREAKAEEGEEFSLESEIRNINAGCTLNLLYRHAIQKMITCLVLENVRLRYVRGDRNAQGGIDYSSTEVAVSQMKGLLDQVIVPGKRDKVRGEIESALSNVFDYRDEPRRMIEKRVLRDEHGAELPNGAYFRVPPGLTTTYRDPATGSEFTVPGVILAVTDTVMRTDSVLCDVIRGQGKALDAYSRGLQESTVASKRLENRRQELALDGEALGLKLVEEGDAERARILRDLRPEPEAESLALVAAPPAAASNGAAG